MRDCVSRPAGTAAPWAAPSSAIGHKTCIGGSPCRFCRSWGRTQVHQHPTSKIQHPTARGKLKIYLRLPKALVGTVH